MYKNLLKPILFLFNPEQAHHIAMMSFKFLCQLPFISTFFNSKINDDNRLTKTIMGISFKNTVGIAAGFDKNASLYKELSQIGFGFIEIGTVTPQPQLGNPKPRLFRLKEDNALINRMGFNNKGVEEVIKNLRKKKDIIIGGNIGKNKITTNEEAISDYIFCFETLFPYVDYFVVNVSSPNTPNLRDLQDKKPLMELLTKLQAINFQKEKTRPILLKIAPDLSHEQLLDVIAIVEQTHIAGIVATNTTISRINMVSNQRNEIGGLSGKPLTDKSTEIIRFIVNNRNKPFVIIGVGGIHTAKDALDKLEAGADLIQLFTGFIYEGPKLLQEINKAIIQKNINS